ncbi:MAG: MFS transporter [Candidatus Aminicenantes bacterium]|nr:MFS transporter [Candidatus Aminicenantes bacterium]
MNSPERNVAPFPKIFWTANVIELFERAAYYSMASFVVIYLGQLGLGDYWPSTLNSVLWFLVYFLPALSGTVADQIGFRRALLLATMLLVAGYFLMGFPVWFNGQTLAPEVSSKVSAGSATLVPVMLAIVLIGIGGSFVKPCIAGSVQRFHMGRATLAFAIFYMVVNIGSIVGRITAFFVRSELKKLQAIFAVAMGASFIAFLVVFFFYRNPKSSSQPDKPRRSIPDILLGMVRVLRSGRFVMFLLVSSGFYFIYNQVYNVLPLYVKKTVELTPAMDMYTMANPIVIVCCQLLITRMFGKLPPIKSIVIGTVIIGLSMIINIYPLLAPGGVTVKALDLIPLGSLFIVLTVAMIAFGELFAASRLYEYIGSLAPKGQEGLFLGYANLPMAIGSLIGGPVGAWLFNAVMCRGAQKIVLPEGKWLLKLDPKAAATGWIILSAFGLLSAASMFAYNAWLKRHPA